MQNARLGETQAVIRIVREISTTSDKQMIPLMAENQEEINSLLMWMRERVKSWLKTKHSEN